ncbi:MAG: CocE/NonD family hydrolase C-terminal non-catalytic domain-containing protein [Chloroflexota bacterium]
MKQLISILLVVGILSGAFALALQGQTYELCQPGAYDHEVAETFVDVSDGSLLGHFYYPDADGGFEHEKLPGILLIHGFNTGGRDITAESSGSNMSGLAADLAEACFVVLLVNVRGQGPHYDVDTVYDWNGPLLQDYVGEDDLSYLTDALKLGPATIQEGDLVNDAALGVMGFSQGGDTSWRMIADTERRGEYLASVPFDGVFLEESWLLGQDCFNGHLAPMFNPTDVRTPLPEGGTATPTATRIGVSWDSNAFPTMQAGYVTAHPPNLAAWQNVVGTREDLVGDLVTATTTPYPHLLHMGSWYDQWQNARQGIYAYNTVTAPEANTPTPGFPDHRLYITGGNGGHSDPPWQGDATGRQNAQVRWMQYWLTPAYSASPTPAGNTPTPYATPAPVEFVIDNYGDASTVTATVALATAQYWPPPGVTPITLYLNQNGSTREALLATPAVGAGYDTLDQYWTPGSSAYNMATAVAEKPSFDSWDSHIVASHLYYVSPPLTQDVTIVDAPKVQLYAEPYGQDSSDNYQVNVRVMEQWTPSGSSDPVRAFITSASACAWNESSTPPAQFTGTEFSGNTRAHKFRSGSRIVIDLSNVNEEIYQPSNSALSISPYLGSFSVRIYHKQPEKTSITLPIIPSNPSCGIFDTCASPGGGQGEQTAAQPEAAPERPQALAISTTMLPDFANSNGWRVWAPKVVFTCTGGEGWVKCPEETVLATEGSNQTFTFTASDAVGAVVTATLSNMSIDLTPPVVSENLPDSQTFCSGSTLLLDYSFSDVLSGFASSVETFNGQVAHDDDRVTLVAGANTLHVEPTDMAGNVLMKDVVVQVNYNTTLDFPPNGQPVNPLLPLPFAFQVNDACAAQGWYNGASGTLWLVSPGGQEQPAEWYGVPTGNSFSLNSLTGWYEFDADLSGLAAGTWTARADLDDGTSRSVTFVIPAAGPNGQDTSTLTPTLSLGGRGSGSPTFDCAADLERNGRYLGGCR